MEIPRDLALERRQQSGPPYSEPLERRGDWNDGSLTTAARRAWDQKQLSVLVEGNEKTIAGGLGWFSVGLGLMELLAPRTLERFLGIRHHGLLLRIMGLREIASGVGILTGSRPSSWLWARVGGDVIDIASLGMAFNSDTAKPANIGLACAAVAGVTVLDLRCAQELSRNDDSALSTRIIEVRKSIQINCSPAEVYKFWRDFSNLPKFMSNVESVETLSEKRSHWCVIGPTGKRLEWDAEITDEQENRLIAWRSLEGAQIENHVRAVNGILDSKVKGPEGDEFKRWLVTVAHRVAEAANEGGLFGFGSERVSEAEKSVVRQIAFALGQPAS